MPASSSSPVHHLDEERGRRLELGQHGGIRLHGRADGVCLVVSKGPCPHPAVPVEATSRSGQMERIGQKGTYQAAPWGLLPGNAPTVA